MEDAFKTHTNHIALPFILSLESQFTINVSLYLLFNSLVIVLVYIIYY